MGMGFDPTWLRQVSPPASQTTLTTEKTPAEYASLEHVAWKTIRFTRDGSTDSHCRFIIHASSRIGLRPAPLPSLRNVNEKRAANLPNATPRNRR